LKNRFKIFLRYFLLLLFLAYYGSITLFSHTHHVENGASIVHSHPFKTGTEKNPVSHQHSKNEFVLIHLLTNFLTTATFLAISFKVCESFVRKIKLLKNDNNFSRLAFLSSNGLRAPPFKYTY